MKFEVKDALAFDGFVVVTGKNSSLFRCIVPEGTKTPITYHPETIELNYLVERIEKWVKDGIHQVVVTSSPFVIDALDVFCTKYKKPIKFFLMDKEMEDVTDNISKIYDSVLPALAKLKEVRHENENS